MFTMTIQPRVGDTDLIGHINNTVPAEWFELARTPLFRIFMPEPSTRQWNLIMVHTDFDFLAQIYYPDPVEVKSWVSHIGNKSFTVSHELWQRGICCTRGNAVMVYFDYARQESERIPDEFRPKLAEHLIESADAKQ